LAAPPLEYEEKKEAPRGAGGEAESLEGDVLPPVVVPAEKGVPSGLRHEDDLTDPQARAPEAQAAPGSVIRDLPGGMSIAVRPVWSWRHPSAYT
jgi:hypothetical protein